MLKVKVKDGENIEKALRQFKKKCNETKLVKQLRDRKEYVKPSVERRKNKLDAIYKNKKRLENED
jgi:small subunit ribosomal protein S21